MAIQDYLNAVQEKWQTGVAREHAYRPALEELIKKILPDLTALNDPARIHVGTLDFILKRGEIDVGYIEAKDIDINLNKVEKSDQLKRYLDLDNLILTDYLEFRFYREGEKYETVRIADALMGQIRPRPENFDKLKALLEEFGAFKGQTIRSSEKLAQMMARKARLMREVFYTALEREEPSSLKDQCKAFKDVLMHDLEDKEFSDIYAQTITYGLFTARLHDPTLDDFSRAEAQGLIPKSNPFLRQLFHYVTGPDLDSRVVWIVDDLCKLFQATNVRKIFEDYGKSTRQTDPVLHFYETFLGAYDKTIKDARGVWFTPEPVVSFIVRAIDDVLKTHFDIKEGIADNSKIEIDVATDVVERGKRVTKKQEVHKVQLLDVATGTGTFLAEVVKQIYPRYRDVAGAWSSYVEKDLLPRLHGFELLMASYAMCHMKLDLLLSELDYKPTDPEKPPRVSVYLTNSLEEHHPDADMLWASFISKEANEASRIKRDMPIMVAFGNPPYSGISSNMNSWIAKNKIEDYKYVDGIHFGERKHWLNDDYVQFIRLGEHYVEKNSEGVLAYISNRYYVENPTFRGMRWHLLNTFDDIYILDLHGQSGINAPDGSADVNVFDIEKGVAIIIAVKKKTKGRKKLANVHYHELWGKRTDKYTFLNDHDLESVSWETLDPREPFYFFIPKTYENIEQYNEGFELKSLFPISVTGIVTARDPLVVDTHKEDLNKRISYFANPENTDDQVREKFFGHKKEKKYKKGDTRGWKLNVARKQIQNFDHDSIIQKVNYRPFDDCWIYYTPEMIDWGREDVMRHMMQKDNIGLVVCRQCISDNWSHAFIASILADDSYVSNKSKERGYVMPLYRYEAVMGDVEQKVPNFDPAIYSKIKKAIPNVTPESLFDYIYGVLHAPAYRARYAEFLKSDFPRIPYPSDPKIFEALSEKGGQIRALHLLDGVLPQDTGVTYPVTGDNVVEKPQYKAGKVFINAEQFFDGVSETAWNFYIGGYQPAQKWLKDRKGRALTMNDIQHYRKVIWALAETDRIMKEIDRIDFLPKAA